MRKILIISNQNNTKQMIQSNATTRGELEVELNNMGIQTSEMSFFEGFSRTELTDSNSQLPAKVMYKGQETTDLIITLTPNSIKKVSNGADYSRDELYRIIKDNNLSEDIYEEFGKRYQMVSTEALNGFVEEYFEENEEEDEDNHEEEIPCGCCYEYKLTPEEMIVVCLEDTKYTLESTLKRIKDTLEKVKPTPVDLRNLDIDELAKEFKK